MDNAVTWICRLALLATVAAAAHPTRKDIRRVGLTLLTVLAALMTLTGLLSGGDAEGRLFAAGFGMIFVSAFSGALVVLRGKRVPLWIALPLAVALLVGAVQINCIACDKSGTMYTHFMDHAPIALGYFAFGVAVGWLARQCDY
jgi:hypothetical protein